MLWVVIVLASMVAVLAAMCVAIGFYALKVSGDSNTASFTFSGKLLEEARADRRDLLDAALTPPGDQASRIEYREAMGSGRNNVPPPPPTNGRMGYYPDAINRERPEEQFTA